MPLVFNLDSMAFDLPPFEATVALLSVGSSAVGWLISDARSKGRIAYIEEKTEATGKNHDSSLQLHGTRLSEIEINCARSDQERAEIHRMIERLDASKASKEVVDGFRSEVANLRIDMDRRFDRIERLIENFYKKPEN